MKTEHDQGQVAAAAAEVYEQFFVPALFGQWPAHVLKAANVQAGNTVLDVACGTGILAREAARRASPGGSVVGIDINEGMLAVARQQAPELAWYTGRAEALPFDEGIFDRVVSQFGLMFFTDPTQAIFEMNRVARPEGTVAVAVWAGLDSSPGYAAMADLLEAAFGEEAARSIQAPFSLGDQQRLGALFDEAGIAHIDIRTLPGQARFSSLDDWLFTDIRGWTLADAIDDEDFERLRQQAAQKLSPFVRSDGTVEFAAPAHIVTFTAFS